MCHSLDQWTIYIPHNTPPTHLSIASTLAPWSSSTLTTAVWPVQLAQWRAVSPSCGYEGDRVCSNTLHAVLHIKKPFRSFCDFIVSGYTLVGHIMYSCDSYVNKMEMKTWCCTNFRLIICANVWIIIKIWKPFYYVGLHMCKLTFIKQTPTISTQQKKAVISEDFCQ